MRGFFILGSLTLLLSACSVYDSSLKNGLNSGGGAGGSSAGGSSGSEDGGAAGSGGGGASGTCTLATYPLPPANHNLGGDREIVAVQSDIDLGDSPKSTIEPTRYLQIGFDLDKVCAMNSEEAIRLSTCVLPTGSQGLLDGPGGIDNAMGSLIQYVRDVIGGDKFSTDLYAKQLREGAANAVLRVTGYNGQPDDDKVTVSVLVSAPFYEYKDEAHRSPKWDGRDAWPIASDSVNGSISKPKNVDMNAYVSGGKLVASLTDAGLRLLIGLTDAYKVNLALHLTTAFTVCDVVPTDAGIWGFTLKNCTLAGRWPADDLVKQLWHFPDPLDLVHPKPLCMNSTSYKTFKDEICVNRDLPSDGTKPPTAPCDALSFGVKFNTEPAVIGDVFDVVDPSMHCDPAFDPSNDSCEADGGAPLSSGGTTGSGGASRDAGMRDASMD